MAAKKPTKPAVKKPTANTAEKPAKPAAKVAAKPAVKKTAVPKTETKQAVTPAKTPTTAELNTLKQADADYQLATTDAVKFLTSRRQAVFNIARGYHLDPEELFQEGYEVLLTCLRDFTPIFTRQDGSNVSVKFTTFFGNRMDGRAMEMRNHNPEYQARAAMTQDMTADEKASFRENPPLLVQHLDLETPMQETLRGEASEALEENAGNVLLKVLRDSFFEKKLNELVAKERDDKKRAILMHVKVGGIYSFQDVAYHFGVTDSRASQILNELMDAFYVQRLIDGDLKSVRYDFQKLKFNDKRAQRLITEAFNHSAAERQKAITDTFTSLYALPAPTAATSDKSTATDPSDRLATPTPPPPLPHTTVLPFEDAFTAAENKAFPLIAMELRDVHSLTPLTTAFRQPQDENKELPHISALVGQDPNGHPLIITEDGQVLDGARRLTALKASGADKVMCMVRRVPKTVDMHLLRVAINIRTATAAGAAPDKTELYYAIAALIDAGLSQQKISKVLGISRTNVIVYAKVKDKAAPAIRQLFEDGFIQITNASSCVDLPVDAQTQLADFIRTYGSSWAKGSQFNTLYDAALAGKMDALKAQQSPLTTSLATSPTAASSHSAAPQGTIVTSGAVQRRLETYEQALKDSEVWTAQREGVIARQTKELVEAQTQIDKLKRELDAAELLKFGDKKALEASFKQLRQFYALVERLAAAIHNITHANKDIRGLELKRQHVTELNDLVDNLDKQLNILRVEMINKTRKS